MELVELDFLNGILSIIVVAISFYVGIYIISKYFEHKKRAFLFVGLVAIITSQPWWPHIISFFLVLSTGENLNPQSYFILGNVLIPVAILLWLISIAEFKYNDKMKFFVIIGLLYLIFFEIAFISFLLLDHNLIGQQIGAIDVQYNPVMLVLLITALGIILPSGILFAMESLKSDNKEIRLKGKFLLLAFSAYCVGAAIDSLILTNPINLISARILLVLGAIGFLGGFIPPNWMKKQFPSKK